MRIGIDFDNTIVSYDTAFHRAAVERALVPAEIAATKSAIRDYLREAGNENEWTKLQGYIYGSGMTTVSAFPGALDFVERCVREGVDVCIISHKTRTPYAGEEHDLHEAARGWLERQGVFDRIGLSRERVFFELTKGEKLERIARERRTVFIDDLPELLADAAFPPGVRRLLFDPNTSYASVDLERAVSWDALASMLLDTAKPAR